MVKKIFLLPEKAVLKDPLYIPPNAQFFMAVDSATPGSEYQSKVTMMKNPDGTIVVTEIETSRIYDMPFVTFTPNT